MCEYGDERCDCDEPDPFDLAARTAREMVEKRDDPEGVCRCPHIHAPDDSDDEEEDEESDDDDEPSRSEAFEVMTPTQFNAHRLEAWQMAHSELTKHNWGDDYKVDPSDVLILARFIEGDDLGD
jgi:hypothetical protein